MPWISCILQEVHRVTEFLQTYRLTGSPLYCVDCIPRHFTGKDGAERHVMPYLINHTPPVGHHDTPTEDLPLRAGQPHAERCDIGEIKVRRFCPVLCSTNHTNRVFRLNIYLIQTIYIFSLRKSFQKLVGEDLDLHSTEIRKPLAPQKSAARARLTVSTTSARGSGFHEKKLE